MIQQDKNLVENLENEKLPFTVEQVIVFLEQEFPWLGTDDDCGSGADIAMKLSDLYRALKMKRGEG